MSRNDAGFYQWTIYSADGPHCQECLYSQSFKRELIMFPMHFEATCLVCGHKDTCDLKPTMPKKPPAPPPNPGWEPEW